MIWRTVFRLTRRDGTVVTVERDLDPHIDPRAVAGTIKVSGLVVAPIDIVAVEVEPVRMAVTPADRVQ